MLKEDVVVMLFQKKVDAIDASQQNRNVIISVCNKMIINKMDNLFLIWMYEVVSYQA